MARTNLAQAVQRTPLRAIPLEKVLLSRATEALQAHWSMVEHSWACDQCAPEDGRRPVNLCADFWRMKECADALTRDFLAEIRTHLSNMNPPPLPS